MAAEQERSSWSVDSVLQQELFELVLKRLVLKDYLKCRGVCRSWRSKVNNAIKVRCPPLPQFPSLLLIPQAWTICNISKCIIRNEDPANLLDVTGNNNLQQLKFPTHAWEGDRNFVQSQEGWLMFKGYYIPPINNIGSSLFWIFNPVSGEKYKLPPLQYSPAAPPRFRAALSSSGPDPQNFLVASWSLNEDGLLPLLSFCRVKDKSWTHIETNNTYFEDVTIFESDLYAVNSHSMTIFNLRDLKARLVMQLPKLDEQSWTTCKLAIDPTSGEVLLVIFTREGDDVKYIHIFKLDMSGARWIEVDNLDGRALFADRFGIRVISTAHLNCPPEFIGGNCVFFSLFNFWRPCLEVFSLKEKTIQQVDVNFPKNSRLFLWFTPGP